MAEFLVELYVARGDSAAVEGGAERARAAAEKLTDEGEAIRYVRAIFVPEDETCFFLYEAESADAVREATRRGRVELRPHHGSARRTERGESVPVNRCKPPHVREGEA